MQILHVLLTEDDPNLGQILHEYLQAKGYKVTLCQDGEAGFTKFTQQSFDLAILDVMMPKMDGFSLAKKIRSVNHQIPIIFLTAKSMREDAIEGFTIGADDYITKPFSMEELLLRLKAITRRLFSNNELPSLQFELGSLLFDAHLSEIRSPKGITKLTTKENELLKLFCQNINVAVLRKVALQNIWGDDSYFNARSMDVYIAKIRKILKDEPTIQLLTVHGEGFKLVRINHIDSL